MVPWSCVWACVSPLSSHSTWAVAHDFESLVSAVGCIFPCFLSSWHQNPLHRHRWMGSRRQLLLRGKWAFAFLRDAFLIIPAICLGAWSSQLSWHFQFLSQGPFVWHLWKAKKNKFIVRRSKFTADSTVQCTVPRTNTQALQVRR